MAKSSKEKTILKEQAKDLGIGSKVIRKLRTLYTQEKRHNSSPNGGVLGN